jgi:hypothetical protein
VYATKSADTSAKRVKNLILRIKTDRIDAGTGIAVVQVAIERAVSLLDVTARSRFDGHPMLVPVPGSGLLKPNSVWPARRVCEELVRHGLGEDVLPVISRAAAVPKSAGSEKRPALAEHLESLAVKPKLHPPGRLLLVDDVVTSGTTLMACAMRLRAAFPGVPVAAFALARVQSEGDPSTVFAPVVQRILVSGLRCVRLDG